ncbi:MULTISPECIES: 23S rRNA (adenine(1618)-N(6))-methyltransferase RlmF [Sphingobacterium]|uniref:Ribosomal RNA large subunit methyltransferase F n=1 Tax=Sphingobacterium siyangense TaxID=459529 RepID=A0A562MKW9_9SPHI|nr:MULTISPECIES: 23S rRNA (adenine(1618)-N(6))-methyltransferase RlmF [Sphingobacterium]QRY59100.1 23S rRNA (adenine(1618)-N(6))-methyltransferase RlmF [Sphingobacterium siyangense]TWI20211.1 23S rRNA (adenine1618-N6)-methyltransferase [Sphingobacterium siyangense]
MADANPKKKLHPRNRHLDNYNFEELSKVEPSLKDFVIENAYNVKSIDFNNPDAVKTLNKALLKKYYHIQHWDIPKENLCPPIPGRADYIHYIADVLARDNNGEIPKGGNIHILDIGVGANCIYPIIGHQEYGWSFVGSEIIKSAYKNAIEITRTNMSLKKSIQIRLQNNPKAIFKDIILPGEKYDVVICNPPFFSSQTEALQQSIRKTTGIKEAKIDEKPVTQAFSGQGSELWCDGGEKAFLSRMIFESQFHKDQVKWFTTLVAHREDIRFLQHKLKKISVKETEVIRMEQGNKVSRILLWRF